MTIEQKRAPMLVNGRCLFHSFAFGEMHFDEWLSLILYLGVSKCAANGNEISEGT